MSMIADKINRDRKRESERERDRRVQQRLPSILRGVGREGQSNQLRAPHTAASISS